MRRRRYLAGVGGLVATGSIALGTGAFTSVEAERSVSIALADDDSAFLRMEPLTKDGIDGDPTGRSRTYGETVSFSVPGTGPGEISGAEGVGLDSTYQFHDLVSISNQGTQPVELYSTYDGSNLADLALVNDGGVLRDDPPTLSVGGSIDVGLYIDTHGSSIGEFDETLTIVADQPDG
jgi:hypothetical protein